MNSASTSSCLRCGFYLHQATWDRTHGSGYREASCPRSPALGAGGNTQAADAGEFQGGAPYVEAKHGSEEVDLKSLHPAERQAEITRERGIETGARGGQPEPSTGVGIVLPDRGRRQNRAKFGHGIQGGLNEGVRI